MRNNPFGNMQLKGLEQRLVGALAMMAVPARLLFLQRALQLVFMLWILNSAAQLFWAAMPAPAVSLPANKILNPALPPRATGASQAPIDVSAALGLGLFSQPGAQEIAAVTTPAVSERSGIEQNARETRLALKLTGIVAADADGMGSAVIEAKNVEQTYTIGDQLPVQGTVTLAKVMPTQVVLDNSGTYELLRLFEESPLDELAGTMAAEPAAPEALDDMNSSDALATAVAPEIASELRKQLYENPESLADVLQVSAVRDDAGLRGYRLAPGRNAQQFKALGLRPGDVVTAVNGLTLGDPANTVRLYQLMRDATDATLEIERDGGTTTLRVSLDAHF